MKFGGNFKILGGDSSLKALPSSASKRNMTFFFSTKLRCAVCVIFIFVLKVLIVYYNILITPFVLNRDSLIGCKPPFMGYRSLVRTPTLSLPLCGHVQKKKKNSFVPFLCNLFVMFDKDLHLTVLIYFLKKYACLSNYYSIVNVLSN
jgi:hypothetical protein